MACPVPIGTVTLVVGFDEKLSLDNAQGQHAHRPGTDVFRLGGVPASLEFRCEAQCCLPTVLAAAHSEIADQSCSVPPLDGVLEPPRLAGVRGREVGATSRSASTNGTGESQD